MAARKPSTGPASTAEPQTGPTAGAVSNPPPVSPPGIELSAAAPLEPPASVSAQPPAPSPELPPTPEITTHQPLDSDDVELVDEDGDELPQDLAELFDLTHPEWTVVYPRVRIYQRRTYTGSRRTVTHLLYTPAQSIPRSELDQFRHALGWD
ncbi:hypothetical protein [Kitasatospora sp. NPDC088346]|uniref:hypothetical protein n=1 Tax=Kitasatospora sp. NPDC088346 TaxID=3364073 RepID=UPI00382DEF1D